MSGVVSRIKFVFALFALSLVSAHGIAKTKDLPPQPPALSLAQAVEYEIATVMLPLKNSIYAMSGMSAFDDRNFEEADIALQFIRDLNYDLKRRGYSVIVGNKPTVSEEECPGLGSHASAAVSNPHLGSTERFTPICLDVEYLRRFTRQELPAQIFGELMYQFAQQKGRYRDRAAAIKQYSVRNYAEMEIRR